MTVVLLFFVLGVGMGVDAGVGVGVGVGVSVWVCGFEMTPRQKKEKIKKPVSNFLLVKQVCCCGFDCARTLF